MDTVQYAIMENKRKWIFVAVLGVLLISCIVFFILTRLNIDSNPSIGIIGGADGPTTIYIASPFTKMYFFFSALAFITADLLILTVIEIVENMKNRKLKLRFGALILVLFNLIAGIMLLPGATLISIGLNIVIIILFVIKRLMGR